MTKIMGVLAHGLLAASVYVLSGWRATALGGGVVMLFVLAIPSFFTPYDMLTPKAAIIAPNRVCQGESVEFMVDRTWREPGLWRGVRSVTVESRWVDVETGQIYPSVETPVEPTLTPLSGVIESDLVRSAPEDPGVYIHEVTYTVNGRAGIVPAYDVNPTLFTNEVEVRAC